MARKHAECSPPNFANETVWTGDCLNVLRGMNSACIDLIYLDPPFNSNRTYEAPIGSQAAGASFKDAWTLDDVDVCEHGELADRNPAAYSVIEAARQAHGKGMQSYLIFRAVPTIPTICNCCVPAAIAARAQRPWPNGGLRNE